MILKIDWKGLSMLGDWCANWGVSVVLVCTTAAASGQNLGVRDRMVVFPFEGTVDEIQTNSLGDAVWQIEEGTFFRCNANSYWFEPEYECTEFLKYSTNSRALDGVRLGGFVRGEKGWPSLFDTRNIFLYYRGDLGSSSPTRNEGIGAAFIWEVSSHLVTEIGDAHLVHPDAYHSSSAEVVEIGAVVSSSGIGVAYWGRTAGTYEFEGRSRYGFLNSGMSYTDQSEWFYDDLELELDDGGVMVPGRVLLMNGQNELLMGGPYLGEGERLAIRGSLSVVSRDGARVVGVDGTAVPGFEGEYELWNLPAGHRPLLAEDYALSEHGEVIFRSDVRRLGEGMPGYETSSLLLWSEGELKSLWEPEEFRYGDMPGLELASARFDRDDLLYTRVWGVGEGGGVYPGAPARPNRVWLGVPGEGTVVFEDEPKTTLFRFRFAEDLGMMVFDDVPSFDRSREVELWAVDVDPETPGEPRRLLGSGDVVITMHGETRTIGNYIELAGVTRTGFVTAVVEFVEGDSGVVRFELRAGIADMNGDGFVDVGDIGAFVEAFVDGRMITDLNGDGVLDTADLDEFLDAFLSATEG